MNKMMNKFLQPKVNFRNSALWENLYGENSHPPSKSNHFVPAKYSKFHQKQNFRFFRISKEAKLKGLFW